MDEFERRSDGKNDGDEWFTTLASGLRLPHDFDRRCMAASQAGFAIDQMRRKRVEPGIDDLPFNLYVQRLAEFAKVNLADIQSSLGIPSLEQVTPSTVPSMARLARLLDLSSSEAERLLRWTFLAAVDPEHAASIRISPRGSAAQASLEEALHRREERYAPAQQADLSTVISAIRSEYNR
jgi:hypothetical protein